MFKFIIIENLSLGFFWDEDEFTLGIRLEEGSASVFVGCLEIMLEIL